MSEYREVKEFLDENGITSEEMDKMWSYLYNKNWKVTNLTNSGLDWPDLNSTARKSLINEYKKELDKNINKEK